MRPTSVTQRWAITVKWLEVSDVRAVYHQLGIRKRTVQQCVDRCRSSVGVQGKLRSGRRCLLDGASEQSAYNLLLSGEQGGSKSVTRHLHASDNVSKVVDRRTITRAARRVAAEKHQRIRVVQGKPHKKLTAATRKKTLAFCKANPSGDWGDTLFSDKKKFPFSYPGSKVQAVLRVAEGQRRKEHADSSLRL
jgi:hypothetical protein